MKKSIFAAMICAVGLLMAATPSMAIHKGSGDLTCGSCHTMHSSQGGTNAPSMGGAAGSPVLLRNANAGGGRTNFCLQCHAENGSQAGDVQNSGTRLTTPPKVFRTTIWANDHNFSTIGAGGDFSTEITYVAGVAAPAVVTYEDARGFGHSINNTAAVTPPGGNSTGVATAYAAGSFGCTTCHDPHGTAANTTVINVFRNLRGGISSQASTGAVDELDTSFGNLATSYVGGAGASNLGGTNTAAANNVWPVYRAVGSQNAYSVEFSTFCTQCHGDWHEDLQAANGLAAAGDGNGAGDWSRHPVGQVIEQGAGDEDSGLNVKIIDLTNIQAAPSGVPVADGSGDGSYTTTAGTATTDQVFCLSCHFAHAGPNFDALRWNYTSAVSPGNQTGVAVPSTVGCQQCHNRGG